MADPRLWCSCRMGSWGRLLRVHGRVLVLGVTSKLKDRNGRTEDAHGKRNGRAFGPESGCAGRGPDNRCFERNESGGAWREVGSGSHRQVPLKQANRRVYERPLVHAGGFAFDATL